MTLLDKIIAELKNAGREINQNELAFVKKYLGTKRKFLGVRSPERDKILRFFKKDVEGLKNVEIIDLLDRLIASDTFEHLNFAGKLLATSHVARGAINFKLLEKWLRQSNGWAECDSICQSLFSAQEVFEVKDLWEKQIEKFANDGNIQIRRASLVLQVKPVRESSDVNLAKIAFETIETLKGEDEVLITKAVSWLLRSASINHKDEVLNYLELNKNTIAKIAYRETIRKIKTGKK